MLILCEHASRRGVANVDSEVREGDMKKILRQIVIVTCADILVLGRPIRSPGSNVFSTESFHEFIRVLEAGTVPQIIDVSPWYPQLNRM